jgi:hypothetical protein
VLVSVGMYSQEIHWGVRPARCYWCDPRCRDIYSIITPFANFPLKFLFHLDDIFLNYFFHPIISELRHNLVKMEKSIKNDEATKRRHIKKKKEEARFLSRYLWAEQKCIHFEHKEKVHRILAAFSGHQDESSDDSTIDNDGQEQHEEDSYVPTSKKSNHLKKQNHTGAPKTHAGNQNKPKKSLTKGFVGSLFHGWLKGKKQGPEEKPEINSQELSRQSQIPLSQESQTFVEQNCTDDSTHVLATDFPNEDGYHFMQKSEMIDSNHPPIMGWALCTTNSRNNKTTGLRSVYKHCLGCYKCPNCIFHERPRAPVKKYSGCLPRPSLFKECPQCCDGTKMQHEECDVEIKWEETNVSWKGTFSGPHIHARPPHNGKISHHAAKEFAAVVMAAPEARPKQLKMGTSTRKSVTKIHETFWNSSKLAYERGKVLNGTKPGSSMSEILSFLSEVEKVDKAKYLTSSSFSPEDAHLTFQTLEMISIINAAYHPLQSDSVEGFIEDLNWNKDVTVTITSTYDEILKKSIIVCLTIMFGKSAKHYHKHFMAVLKSYKIEDSAELFIEKFPGNTCDFSDAERIGFFSAMTEYLQEEYGIQAEKETLMSLYKFCNVHFIKSMTRVARNHRVIPHAEQVDFRIAVESLRLFTMGEFDQFKLECIEFFRMYPVAKNWLKWYLHPDRAPIFFDACKSLNRDQWEKVKSLDPDTNAQENVGKQYQETFGKKQKSNLGEAIQHTWRYLNLDSQERSAALKGHSLTYGF